MTSGDLLGLLPRHDLLSFRLDAPGFNDFFAYHLDHATGTLYTKAPKALLQEDPVAVTVLAFAGPHRKYMISGTLCPAGSPEDARRAIELAILSGVDEAKARGMVLDPRSGKSRKNNRKLRIEDIALD